MQIDYCYFPEDVLYDIDNLVWAKISRNDKSSDHALVRVGITPILACISGKISSLKIKPVNSYIVKGKSLGTLESTKYFGVIRSPITGWIDEINEKAVSKPKLANDVPYDEGWIVKINSSNIKNDVRDLDTIVNCQDKIRRIIQDLKIRCFSVSSDVEMVEIGSECVSVLTKLEELSGTLDHGEVVHLVSDNPFTNINIFIETYIRWSELTGHLLLDIRKEGNLFHFMIKKT
jgi:glycine cleavage system H protein